MMSSMVSCVQGVQEQLAKQINYALKSSGINESCIYMPLALFKPWQRCNKMF